MIRNTSKKWPIDFVEAEYRPSYGAHRAHGSPAVPTMRLRSPAVPRMRLRRRDPRAELHDTYDDDIPLHVV